MAESELPQNVALSRSVGWKDVESEWRVLHRAGRVRGVRVAGRVVAQGVLGDYGNCASLAKMVVATEQQRQGLGARLLDLFLSDADARQLPVGLCATEQGRPLYESRGFQVSGEVMILFGKLQPEPGPPDPLVAQPDVEQVVALDAAFSGCDRSRMLRARFAEASLRLSLADARGFALATEQGDHLLLGPVLAETEAGARALFSAAARAAPGNLRVDVPLEHAELRRWLVERGLAEMSQRVEMSRGAARLPWQTAHRFALASQAWG